MLVERILSIYDNVPLAIIENAFSMMKLTNISIFYPSKKTFQVNISLLLSVNIIMKLPL